MNPAPTNPVSPAARLEELQQRKSRIHAAFAKLDHGLANGEITAAEYHYYINKVYDGKQEHEHLHTIDHEIAAITATTTAAKAAPRTQLPAVAALLFIIVLGGIASLLLLSHGGPTPSGFVTLEPQPLSQQLSLTLTNDSLIPLNRTNITGASLTGSLTGGTAQVYLVAGIQRVLLYTGDASPPKYQVLSPYASYAMNESITVTVLPASASYTLWLTDTTGQKTPVQDNFTAAPGAYTLDALIDDNGTAAKATTTILIRNDNDTTKDVNRSAPPVMLPFTDACGDACNILPTQDVPLSLDATVSPGTTLTITSIAYTEAQTNRPPVLTGTVPNLTVAVGDSTTIDLGLYFTDPDNDTLTYDFLAAPGTSMNLNGSLLTITGVAPGASQTVVYASDLYNIAQSNVFTITVTPGNQSANVTTNTTENTTNESANVTNENATNITTTANETNGTLPENVTNATTPPENLTANGTNTTLDCSNPDLNLRPLECLQENASKYFNDTDKYWENPARVPVAKFNAVGNMLITGDLIEHSAGVPTSSDFALGYNDADSNFVATIWIDEQGNLNLKGTLHEEQLQLYPQPGSYSLITRRSIFIMYADTATGDLYLRGNLIPGRRSIE